MKRGFKPDMFKHLNHCGFKTATVFLCACSSVFPGLADFYYDSYYVCVCERESKE